MTSNAGLNPKRYPYNQWAPDTRALDIVGDKWTLLIIRDLVSGPRRFVNLQRTLPGISTEQLRTRLNRMVTDGLLTRTRYREVPPRVDYNLTERGKALIPIIAELAKWGFSHSWSEPRSDEAVDIGAFLRSVIGLLDGHDQLDVVELVELSKEGARQFFLYGSWEVPLAEGENLGKKPVATITGSTPVWIDALKPAGNIRELRVVGNRPLAWHTINKLQKLAGHPRLATA